MPDSETPDAAAESRATGPAEGCPGVEVSGREGHVVEGIVDAVGVAEVPPKRRKAPSRQSSDVEQYERQGAEGSPLVSTSTSQPNAKTLEGAGPVASEASARRKAPSRQSSDVEPSERKGTDGSPRVSTSTSQPHAETPEGAGPVASEASARRKAPSRQSSDVELSEREEADGSLRVSTSTSQPHAETMEGAGSVTSPKSARLRDSQELLRPMTRHSSSEPRDGSGYISSPGSARLRDSQELGRPMIRPSTSPEPRADSAEPEGGPELSLLEVMLLSLWYLPFLVMFLLVFTEVGFGASAFKMLVHAAELANVLAVAAFVLLFVLYCLDASSWERGPVRMRRWLLPIKYLLLTLWMATVVIGVCLTFKRHPYAPLLSYMVGMCCLCFGFYRAFHRSRNLKSFLQNLGFTVVLWGFAGLVGSILWAELSGFWWNAATHKTFQDRLRVCANMTVAADGSGWCTRYGYLGVECRAGCEEVEAESACPVGEDSCFAAFLLWATPFILAVITLLVGACLRLIANAETHETGKPDVGRARLFLIFLMVFASCIWFAASIASASPKLAEMVSALALTGLSLLVGLLGCVVGFREAGEALVSEKLYAMLETFRHSDWVKGALVLLGAPFFICFLLLSLLNQLVRRNIVRKDKSHPLTGRRMNVDELNLIFTAKGIHLITELGNWDWTAVISKSILLGFAYFIFMVGVTHWVSLFMAWLNMVLAASSVWTVSAAIFFIAQCLFAIPVVPGVPAYLASGVIIANAGKNEGWSFEVCMLWAIVVAQACKQASFFVEQKVFGEWLGSALWVRSALGVNTKVTKGIKLIFLAPGVTLHKVFLLVGGPDWPTSVLAGVLGIPAIPCQLGTLPVVVPIGITVLSGGAMTKEGESWESMAGLLLMLSAATLGGSFIFFFIALERVLDTRAEEIERMLKPVAEGGEFDEEVAKFEKEQAAYQQVKVAVSSWPVLGSVWQTVLVLSLATMTGSTAIFALYPEACFNEVKVTTDLSGPPIYGNALNLVKAPMGWWGLGLQFTSLVLLLAFRYMQGVRSRNTHVDLAAA